MALYLNIGISNYGDRLVSSYGRRKPLIAIGTLLIFFGGTIISFPDESSVNLIGQVTVALTFVTFGRFSGYFLQLLDLRSVYDAT